MTDKRSIPSIVEINYLRDKLIKWFDVYQRDYPWRNTNDPFRVLIAEIMLRRTKADQVKDVYRELFNTYPDIDALANAGDELNGILYHLGLQWRQSAFRNVVSDIKIKYNSKVPETREELKKLEGVGDYVAGAVLSIAMNKNEWIVDSNIVRLFQRYFGIETSKEGRRDKHIIEFSKIYSSDAEPRKANLAILDFTAIVCKPGKPICGDCIINTNCVYFKTCLDNRVSV
ncbi:MAG: DNA glycosylase [Spirochaetae bacterium HGW-Spirochaetae-5]|nr:MAG: DNA glycosylase [Spirochaetae bacterium HGW-Spirochaetae-5]